MTSLLREPNSLDHPVLEAGFSKKAGPKKSKNKRKKKKYGAKPTGE